MKKNAGFAIIIIGLLLTVFSGLNSMHKEVLIDTGSFTISRDTNTSMVWLPLAGVAVMAIGGLLIYNGFKSKKSMS